MKMSNGYLHSKGINGRVPKERDRYRAGVIGHIPTHTSVYFTFKEGGCGGRLSIGW
jgi:hypothetical protein